MWAHVINAALGIWLMAAPSVFGYANSAAATNDRFAGPLIATFAIVAWWETTRPVGRWNVVIGAWLVVAPFILGYASTAATINGVVCGLAVAGLSLVMGTYRPERFGGSWSALWSDDPQHAEAAARLGRGERGRG